jgi:ABC-type molybdate transport system permease subunit
MTLSKPVLDNPDYNPLALSITGWILSAVPSAALAMAGGMLIARPAFMVEEWIKNYPDWSMLPLGIVTIGAVLLYLVPRTSVLGAILITGYLGGAVATHIHQKEAFGWVGAVIAGGLVWLGLVCRDPKVRAVLPIRW